MRPECAAGVDHASGDCVTLVPFGEIHVREVQARWNHPRSLDPFVAHIDEKNERPAIAQDLIDGVVIDEIAGVQKIGRSRNGLSSESHVAIDRLEGDVQTASGKAGQISSCRGPEFAAAEGSRSGNGS